MDEEKIAICMVTQKLILLYPVSPPSPDFFESWPSSEGQFFLMSPLLSMVRSNLIKKLFDHGLSIVLLPLKVCFTGVILFGRSTLDRALRRRHAEENY